MGFFNWVKKTIFGIDPYFVPTAEYYNFIKQGHSKKKARELTEKQRKKRMDIENKIYEQKRKIEMDNYISKYIQLGYSKKEAIKKAEDIMGYTCKPFFNKSLKKYENKGYPFEKAVKKAKRDFIIYDRD